MICVFSIVAGTVISKCSCERCAKPADVTGEALPDTSRRKTGHLVPLEGHNEIAVADQMLRLQILGNARACSDSSLQGFGVGGLGFGVWGGYKQSLRCKRSRLSIAS